MEKVMKMRILAALAVLVSALIHLKLWKDVFRHTDTVGPAMLLNFFGGVVIAVLLVTWKHWVPLVLAVGFGVSTFGSFIIATTSGLYGVHEKWTGWEVFTAAAVEIVAIIVGGALLLRERPKQTSRV
jgi:hypothetical protein